jgi:S1/P1 nuclease
MQIALSAYASLSPERQRELVTLLRQHPRFAADFATQLPAGVRSDADLARWIFAHASTWPDLARGQPQYEHGSWHYVNLPLYLRQGELVSCATARAAFPESVRRVRELTAAREGSASVSAGTPESIIHALGWAERTLHDLGTAPSERALALSWLLHLVGDAHQPLHGVALFSARRFEMGDRGGNEILLVGRGSLHQVWDGLLGSETTLAALMEQAEALTPDVLPRRPAPDVSRELDLDAWFDESCAAARSFVYVPAILSAVERFERDGRTGKPELSLSPAYIHTATALARRRAAVASARLTLLLRRLPYQL